MLLLDAQHCIITADCLWEFCYCHQQYTALPFLREAENFFSSKKTTWIIFQVFSLIITPCHCHLILTTFICWLHVYFFFFFYNCINILILSTCSRHTLSIRTQPVIIMEVEVEHCKLQLNYSTQFILTLCLCTGNVKGDSYNADCKSGERLWIQHFEDVKTLVLRRNWSRNSNNSCDTNI